MAHRTWPLVNSHLREIRAPRPPPPLYRHLRRAVPLGDPQRQYLSLNGFIVSGIFANYRSAYLVSSLKLSKKATDISGSSTNHIETYIIAPIVRSPMCIFTALDSVADLSCGLVTFCAAHPCHPRTIDKCRPLFAAQTSRSANSPASSAGCLGRRTGVLTSYLCRVHCRPPAVTPRQPTVPR